MSLSDPHDYVEEFLEFYEKDVGKSAYYTAHSACRDFADWLEDQDIGMTEVAQTVDGTQYRNYMEMYIDLHETTQYPDSTVRTRWGAIRSMWDYLAERRGLVESPVDSVAIGEYTGRKTEKEKHSPDDLIYLTADEVEKLLDGVNPPEFRNRLGIRLQFSTGMRAGEMMNLKMDDINISHEDGEASTVTVRTLKREEGETRKLGIIEPLELPLRRWMEVERDALVPDTDRLFPTIEGSEMTARYWNRVVRKAADNAGIQEVMYTDQNGTERKKYTSHALRAGFAMHCLEQGVDLESIRKMMGHADLDSLSHYVEAMESMVVDRHLKTAPRVVDDV